MALSQLLRSYGVERDYDCKWGRGKKAAVACFQIVLQFVWS
jgi:hypothetical protein